MTWAGAELWRAWLAGILPWAGLSTGALFLLILWHLVGGEWGRTVWPALSAAARSIVVPAVLFVPVLLNLGDIYPWATARQDHPFRAVWLSEWFFSLRAAGYFVVWIVLALLLAPVRPRRRPAAAAVGAILHVPVASAAAFDWVMALDARFISTIMGLLFMAVQLALATSFAIVAMLALRPKTGNLPSLAGLLMATVLLWAYCSYMQLLVIWSGDEPAEIAFYMLRGGIGWQTVIWLVAIVGGVVPFFALLSTTVRTRRNPLMAVAVAVLLGQIAYVQWLVVPWWQADWLWGGVVPALLVVALGGLWLAAVRWLMTRGAAPGAGHA